MDVIVCQKLMKMEKEMQNAKIKRELCSRTLRPPSDWLTMHVGLLNASRVFRRGISFIIVYMAYNPNFSGLG